MHQIGMIPCISFINHFSLFYERSIERMLKRALKYQDQVYGDIIKTKKHMLKAIIVVSPCVNDSISSEIQWFEEI